MQAYPVLSNQQDAWLSAPTGSGKTLAYLLPLLERIDAGSKDLQLAVLSPTQELAVQIHECIRLLEKDNEPAIRSQLLIGNASVIRQKEKLKKKPHVVVGTVGRMIELSIQRKLKLHRCHMIVIDEADNMLADDSIEEVEAFLKMTPRDQRQLLLLRFNQGLTLQKISDIMQLGDPFRIHRQLQTAMRNLASLLREDEKAAATG